jgi:hypothetical protein
MVVMTMRMMHIKIPQPTSLGPLTEKVSLPSTDSLAGEMAELSLTRTQRNAGARTKT